jgi:hypothetical protein
MAGRFRPLPFSPCLSDLGSAAGRGRSDPGWRAMRGGGYPCSARGANTDPLCPCPPPYPQDTHHFGQDSPTVGRCRACQRCVAQPVRPAASPLRWGAQDPPGGHDQGAWLRALQCPASPLTGRCDARPRPCKCWPTPRTGDDGRSEGCAIHFVTQPRTDMAGSQTN